MLLRRAVVLCCLAMLMHAPARGQTPASDCLAMAQLPVRALPVAYAPASVAAGEVKLTFAGHSTFVIETAGGIRVATDYSGFAGTATPDAVTMNRAHSSHYTDFPDPAIKHILRGWSEDGTPARHDVSLGDLRVRNVTTDIRGGGGLRLADGNSIFIFEAAGLCIGHLGHLHHELTPAHQGLIGRLDVVMVPVDGGYTMAQVNMVRVLTELKARIVLPMHYFGPDTLARFVDNARADFEVEFTASPVLVISAGTLPPKPRIIVLPGH